MSEPKVRREASLLTIIGLSHAEHVAIRATRRVPNDYQSVFQASVADDSTFAVVLARVFDLDRRPFEDDQGILEVETALYERLLSLGWIVGQAHSDSVSTKTVRSKMKVETRLLRRLTFELTGRQRRDGRPGLAKMYRVPPDRAWWPAVGAPLEGLGVDGGKLEKPL